MSSSEEKSGTVYVFLAAVLFSIGGLCIKIVPWNAMAINGARNLIAAVMIGTYLKVMGHRLLISPAVLFGAVCLTGTTTMYTLANKLTTAANTIVLQYTAPVFVIFLTWLFFKKRPKKADLYACVFVLIGIICFFVDGIGAGNQLGNILAVVSGISYAGVFMMNSFEKSDSLSSIFLGQVFSAVIGIGFVFQETDFGVTAVAGILALGVFQLGLAYIFMAKGLENVSAVTACLTAAIEPILNPILTAVFWNERISPLAFIGAAIVVVSVVVYNLNKAKQKT